MSYPYSVQIFFCAATENRVKHVWADMFKKAGLTNKMEEIIGLRPHISFGFYGAGNKEKILACVSRLAGEQPPFELNFAAIGIFDGAQGTPFFAPTITQELVLFHVKCHDEIIKICPISDEHYQPGKIVYHCSVALGLTRPELLKAADVMLDAVLPIKARIESIGLLTASPESFTYSYALGKKTEPPSDKSPGQ